MKRLRSINVYLLNIILSNCKLSDFSADGFFPDTTAYVRYAECLENDLRAKCAQFTLRHIRLHVQVVRQKLRR